MASIAGVSLTSPRILSKSSETQSFKFPTLNNPWKNSSSAQFGYRKMYVVRATPDNKLSDLIAESVKEAEEACAENPVSGECVAAWDVVEETSAAASHARDKKKDNSDPLENYCKDNPETDECRTYDN
ncbi:calvin cycle protein CP12-1, chloroplastic-like [Lycium ferocissimum]|uniref:calvin cycle protein CP12-1, chloroplastic-like n=1 Tax=Lycium ferocissimum TaxID=112874 RepID=UPI002814D669|nr:calvin cycle protein CP12-1, chloroplastic-like [Lycium ferocissimum]